MTESQRLLADYLTNGSEVSFRELVEQYVGLVYSTAVRLLNGDTHLAQDVAQIVFVDLARSAKNLSEDVKLGGWLHRHTCFVASKTLRSERRRQSREEHASQMKSLQGNSEASLSELASMLDEAVNQLGQKDRTAIVLRFFERLDFASIGESLGSNEAAAQKRVTRALAKLHLVLRRRGCMLSVAALGAAISSHSISAAPVGLAPVISNAALAGIAASAAITVSASKTLAMTTLHKAITASLLALTISTAIYEARKASRLSNVVQQIQRRQLPFAEQIQQLQRERDEATDRFGAVSDQLQRAQKDSAELTRLRGEVARLRLESKASVKSAPAAESGDHDAWLNRVRLLKQRVAETTEAQTPELRFLEEDDWLMAAKRKLETEDDFRAAMSELQGRGEGNFLGIMERALRKFLNANKGQFPTEVTKLTPYFDSVPPDDLLERFQIVPSSSLPQGNFGDKTNDWFITPKSPIAGGALWALGQTGVSGVHNYPAMDVLAPAIKALLDAAPVINGKKQVDIHQLPPHLTTPEQQAAYQELIQRPK
jgi:RNA polymerase sigma factor (sigma-70 family)